MKNAISLCLIAKNEEKNVDSCLQLFRNSGFEIVVADTGSSDNTKNLLSTYTSNIYDYKWQDNFSAARNFCISKASNDWILVVDFDEQLEKIDFDKLDNFISTNPKKIGTITRRNPCHLLSGQDSVMTEQVARLFNRKFHHYEGKIHEQILPCNGSEPSYISVPISFFHNGYQDQNVLNEKANRDLRILLAELEVAPDDSYLKYQIGKCYQVKKDYDKACDYYDQGLSGDLNTSLVYVQDMIEAYGYSLLEKGDFETALGLTAVYDLFNRSADFLFLMGLIYMNNTMFEQAINEFLLAAAMPMAKTEGINGYLSYYNIGVIYECAEKFDQATFFYHKCKHYDPALSRLAIIGGY